MARDTSSLLAVYPHISNLGDAQGFWQLLLAYLDWLALKNYTPATLRTRGYQLCRFVEWACQRGLLRPSEVSLMVLERYQRYLFHYRQAGGEPLSFRSQVNLLTSVRSWYRWLVRQHHVPSNPASELELPRLGKQLPDVMSEEEAERVVRQPDVGEVLGLRDRTLLELLYSTGLRRMEVLGLHQWDVELDAGILKVREGKGQKDRLLPLGERTVLWLERYQQEVRPQLCCGQDEGELFLSATGQRLGSEWLSAQVKHYLRAAGVNKRGSCHLFRHTMATLMLENGADVRFIQAMLGHDSINSTQLYTHVSLRKLREVHMRTHPGHREAEAEAEE